MNASLLIKQLQLEPHPEGGYFRRSYTSAKRHHQRPLMSSIYYLLTHNQPIGHLHRNQSDILHFWQGGGPLRYTLLNTEGQLEEIILGPDLEAGQQLQLVVAGGLWKASELLEGEFGLISEAVCPGFDYTDQQMASEADIRDYFPQHWPQLQRLICK